MFDKRIKEYANTQEFFDSLVRDVQAIDIPEKRFKAKMELIAYIQPKLKTVDVANTGEAANIRIVYLDAEVPDEDSTTTTPESNANVKG